VLISAKSGEGGNPAIKIRSNFDMKVGLKKSKVGSVLDKWSADIIGTDVVLGGAGWTTIKVCVEAWKAKLYEQKVLGNVGEKFEVGELTITVKPNV